MTAFNAHAATVTYILDNVVLAGCDSSDVPDKACNGSIPPGQTITGTFDFNYSIGDFENGTGVFTALEIPGSNPLFMFTELDLQIQADGIEITSNGNYHDTGLDITMKFAGGMLLNNATTGLDTSSSFYECCGNGFSSQYFASGSFIPTVSSIPLPAAVWLFGSALGLLGRQGRKVE
jgi:hypothetical protein